MTRFFKTCFAPLLSVLLMLTACSTSRPAGLLPAQFPAAGHLLICGGGIKDDNADIYNRFMELAGTGPVGVVPTATGEDSRGQDTIDVLSRYAGDRKVVLIPLMKEDIGKGDDASVAAMIDSCSALWFVGGDQSRILAVFRPAGADGTPRDTMCYTATMRLLARGGVIAGTSAGAAMQCDPMITGGTSASAIEHGATWTNDPKEDQGVGLAHGMGYVKGIMLDQHFLQRGRLGRLLVAMEAAKVALGAGISENCALEVNRRTGEVREWGKYGVFVVDQRGLRRQ